jgi:hypothetical protein
LYKDKIKGGKRMKVGNLFETLRGSAKDWKVTDMVFSKFVELMKRSKSEGIVLLGAGGNLNEWIDGVTETLIKEKILQDGATVKQAAELFSGAYKLTTSGGRSDLALVFKSNSPLNIGKMAIWRRVGDWSWISDYLDNYAKQHNA